MAIDKGRVGKRRNSRIFSRGSHYWRNLSNKSREAWVNWKKDEIRAELSETPPVRTQSETEFQKLKGPKRLMKSYFQEEMIDPVSNLNERQDCYGE